MISEPTNRRRSSCHFRLRNYLILYSLSLKTNMATTRIFQSRKTEVPPKAGAWYSGGFCKHLLCHTQCSHTEQFLQLSIGPQRQVRRWLRDGYEFCRRINSQTRGGLENAAPLQEDFPRTSKWRSVPLFEAIPDKYFQYSCE